MRASILAALTAVLLITSFATCGQPVPHHSITASYSAERREIEGALEMTFVPSGSTAYLSLLANLGRTPNPHIAARLADARYPYGFEESMTLVTSVEHVAGEAVTPREYRLLAMPAAWQTYSLEDGVLAVDLDEIAVGDEITLRIGFVTKVPRTTIGDDGITDGILTWRFGWSPTLLPEQEHIIETGSTIDYDHRDAFPLLFPWAEYQATIQLPEDHELISGAAVIKEEDAETEGGQHEVTVGFDSPARALAITIASEYEHYVLNAAYAIDVAYLRGHEEEARLLATLALDILAEYEVLYGPYPRQRLTIVENPNTDGRSFAADGIVWLSTWFFTHRNVLLPGALNRMFEYVLAHEIAHQWVGLGTGIDLNTDAWLSEGLAQYLAIRYFEKRYGSFGPNLFEQEADGLIEQFVEREFGFFNLREHFIELPYVVTRRIGFDEALIVPMDRVQYSNVSDVRLYDKGYLVARSIAATIGEETFDLALARAIAEHRAGLLDARAFQRLLEEESETPLQDLFDAWVYGAGSVDYSIELVSRTRDATGYQTTMRVRRKGGVPQPVDVEMLLVSGATLRKTWDGTETEHMLTLHTPSFVQRVTIDPDHRHPDEDRLNNNSPVKVVGAANERVLPLDAYVLAPDVETNGVIFTHLDRLRITVGGEAATAQIKIGRHHLLNASISVADNNLSGQVGYTYTEYAQPPTGSPGTYWEADISISVGAERRVSGGDPFHIFHLDIVDLPSIAALRTQRLSIDITPQGAGRLTFSADDELRLLPGVYLQGAARVGFGFGELPRTLYDRPSGLHAFSFNRTPHVACAKLAFEIPDARSRPYNLLNLAMVDRARGRLFATAGAGWTTLDEFSTTSPSVEAGIEQIIELSTLGGLLPLTLQIGVATPVVGDGTTVLYAQLSL